MSVPKRVIVVGISGSTCSGKTTLARELHKLLKHSTAFCQDNYFFPVEYPNHVWIPELNHINWDIVTSIDMEKMTNDIQQLIAKESAKIPQETLIADGEHQVAYSKNDKFEYLSRINQSQYHVVIAEGFCIFNYKPLAELCDLKYYCTLEYEECLRRRVKRVYEPPDCPGYFDKCVWPEHLKQLAEVKHTVENVAYFNGNSSSQIETILKNIAEMIQ